MDELELAAQAYKEAEQLLKEKINNNQEVWQAAYELRRDISDIYEQLYRQSQEYINNKMTESVNCLVTLFTALISAFGPVAAGVVCKYFKLPAGGIMLSLFGSMQYSFGEYANVNLFRKGPVQSVFIQHQN